MRQPKVVLPEKLGSQSTILDRLSSSGYEVIRIPATADSKRIADLVAETDAIVCNPRLSCPSSIVKSASRLRAVVSTVIGVDHIDVGACTEHGIVVANGAVPENYLSMAEATVLAMLAVCKELNRKQQTIREGRWRPEPLGSFMLRGKTIGFVGFGRVAQGVATRLQGWEVKMLAYDPYLPAENIRAKGVEPVDLERLLSQSDFVSVHVVLTDETRDMIGPKEIALMKAGSVLINNSRGGVVNETALAEALNGGHLFGAAIDTFAIEPTPNDNPLFGVHPDKLLLTGHCIGHGPEVTRALVAAAVENLTRVMRGEPPLYPVNPDVLPAWRERIAQLDQKFGLVRPS